MDQGVVFGESNSFQMIQPIMVKTKTGQQDSDQITLMLSHVNQTKQFCKRQMFLKTQKLQSELPEKLEASNDFTLTLLETMGQGVSFEPSFTIQMLKLILGNESFFRARKSSELFEIFNVCSLKNWKLVLALAQHFRKRGIEEYIFQHHRRYIVYWIPLNYNFSRIENLLKV